jgi:hypothetical protein
VRRKRNRFRVWEPVASKWAIPDFPPGPDEPDSEIADIAEWFRIRDSDGAVTAEVVRDALDLVLDGQRTGRWCYGHLTKTEKTHLGTVIEIELQKEFDISDEGPLDYAIAGIPVDCKFAAQFGKWQIPREMYRREEKGELLGEDHIALLIWAEEKSRLWRAGLLRVTDERLATGSNQDRKRTLAAEALKEIHWIWDDPVPLPENTLVALSDEDRNAVFAHRSGQKRINELLRRVQGRVLRRAIILTVAQQEDSMKRPRDARSHLQPEGFLVIGHLSKHRRVAQDLGVDDLATLELLPDKGEFVAVRVVKVALDDPRPKTQLDGEWWALAAEHDELATGPKLPWRREAEEDEEDA